MNQVIDLQGVANFRDVGQTVNQFLDDASPADKALIKDDLGIRTIIDLRTKYFFP
ncbi:hypothetical protein E4U54_007200 [Claviceps lovelessii]|nr:hypothetical protein E4U54_007200 [Claviceps lovelessii]